MCKELGLWKNVCNGYFLNTNVGEKPVCNAYIIAAQGTGKLIVYTWLVLYLLCEDECAKLDWEPVSWIKSLKSSKIAM